MSRFLVEVVHRDLIDQHGGAFGVRDEGLLESALARPRNRWTYGENPDLAELAAVYAHGLARSHPFVDGNKRTALMAAYTFLAINGLDLDAPEPEAAAMVVALSAGDLSEEEFAAWLRGHADAT
ncbi:MAG: type II toxin-antitoxin system death-on-curing family toxin [Gemmatimonadota bacterium]